MTLTDKAREFVSFECDNPSTTKYDIDDFSLGVSTSIIKPNSSSSGQLNDSVRIVDDDLPAPRRVDSSPTTLEFVSASTSVCPMCFKSCQNLEAHFTLEHREYECPICTLLFDNEIGLNRHLELDHLDEIGTGGKVGLQKVSVNICND